MAIIDAGSGCRSVRGTAAAGWRGVAVALLAAVAAGVGGGCRPPRTMATVTGVVSVDGQPLDNGSIAFYPVPHEGRRAARSAGSTIDKQGRYRADILPGRFRVEISSSRIVGQRKAYPEVPDSPVEDVLAERVPAEYNTESRLVADIALETKTVDFQLESKPPARK